MAAMMVPLSSDQVAQLQANATMANSKLMEIESNQTLSNTCAEVNQVTVPCMEYAGLTKLEDLAQNDTKIASLQQKKNLTDAQVTSLKSFVSPTGLLCPCLIRRSFVFARLTVNDRPPVRWITWT